MCTLCVIGILLSSSTHIKAIRDSQGEEDETDKQDGECLVLAGLGEHVHDRSDHSFSQYKLGRGRRFQARHFDG